MRDPTARPLWLAQRRLAVAQALGGERAAAAAGRPQPCPSLTQRLDEPVGGQAARGGDGRAAREADGVEGSLVAAEGRVLDHLRGGRVGGPAC